MMGEEEENLADSLKKIMALTIKYDFDYEDVMFLMDRSLLLGEAMSLIEELGLYNEVSANHKNACEKASKTMMEGF